jgi:hypothetical protein
MVGQISIAVFSGIHDILNASRDKKAYLVWFWLKLVPDVLVFNLHNETISRNNSD